MKKIILLAIFVLVLGGCTKKEINNENVLTNESNTLTSGDKIKEESGENFEEMDEDLEITSGEADKISEIPDVEEEEIGVLVSDYYDTYEELLYLYENDPFLKELTNVTLETRYYEGMPVKVVTAKYESQLGYSMRYDPYSFKIKTENGKDSFYIEDNTNMFVTIEKVESSYEDMLATLGSYEVDEYGKEKMVYVPKIYELWPIEGNDETNYYVKANDGYYIITTSHPSGSEYVEGIGTSMAYMLGTFEINK